MLNIVVPMAGLGSRYSKEGYALPKPLIDVMGKPMIKRVIDNLTPQREHRFIFIVRQEHVEQFHIDKLLHDSCKSCRIISIDHVTEGQACSALLARDYINNNDPVMIANCDQYVRANMDDYLSEMERENADGLIMTLKAYNPAWSYVKFGDNGLICEVVEKQVVSEHATVGIFNFARGKDFVWAAEEMIRQNLRVNGEFYVAPVYNMIINKGAKVIPYNIGTVGNGMYGLGTSEELEWVMKNCPSIFEEE